MDKNISFYAQGMAPEGSESKGAFETYQMKDIPAILHSSKCWIS